MEDRKSPPDAERATRLLEAGDTVNSLMRSGRGIALDIGDAAAIAAARHSGADVVLDPSEILSDVRARSASIATRLAGATS